MLTNCDKLFAKILKEENDLVVAATVEPSVSDDSIVVSNSLVKDDITKSEEEYIENKVVSYICTQLISHVSDLKKDSEDEEAKAYLDVVKQKYLKLIIGEYNKP